MDIKKLLMGGIVGGILYFGLGYLIYGNLLTSFMANNPGTATGVDRPMADYLFIYLAAGNLLQGFLLAYIFIRANVNTAASGIMTGGIVGLLMSASIDMIIYSTTNIMSKKMMAADIVAFTVMSAVVGAIVAVVMGMGKKAA